MHRAWALGERRDRPGSTKNGTDRSLYRMKGKKLQPAAVRRSRRDEHRRKSPWVDCTPLQRTWLFPKITNRSAVAITSGNGSDLRKLSRKSAGPERLLSAGNEGCAQACWNLVAGWHVFRRGLASNLNRLAYLNSELAERQTFEPSAWPFSPPPITDTKNRLNDRELFNGQESSSPETTVFTVVRS